MAEGLAVFYQLQTGTLRASNTTQICRGHLPCRLTRCDTGRTLNKGTAATGGAAECSGAYGHMNVTGYCRTANWHIPFPAFTVAFNGPFTTMAAVVMEAPDHGRSPTHFPERSKSRREPVNRPPLN
ncbi:hypothetical protein DPEC_G00102970 [Dallia pectoralis]|uniref:Uncharacterized protein n=1 Tax=Dallia pectoralis TaxID=75939 RepID=A0ACC2GXN5_DALPE|nr:hypothetical protein DPEC_G00102970 [Dallia pectoralis]